MEQPVIIDSIFLFLLAFTVLVSVLFINTRDENAIERKKLMDRRILELSKQQDMLLETSNERISTFAKSGGEDALNFDVSTEGGIIAKFRAMRKKAGINEIGTTPLLASCCVGGILFAVFLAYFEFLDLVMSVSIGSVVGFYLTFNFYTMQSDAKRKIFLKQLPDAIEMMIRGVKAGLNIGRIMRLVSMESKDPIASECKTISQKLDLGIKPDQVFIEAGERVNIEEFRFLVVALILQMENGGGLSEILTNLAGIVRKRLELDLKVKAMSSEARMSAIVLSALPFVFVGMMTVVNPAHVKEFVTPGTGQTLLKAAISLFAAGVFFMFKATKIKV